MGWFSNIGDHIKWLRRDDLLQVAKKTKDAFITATKSANAGTSGTGNPDIPGVDLAQKNRNVIKSLMSIPGMDGIEENELQALLRLREIRHYRAGECIMKEGSMDGRIYYLISGKVKLVRRSKTLMTLQRVGDVFGEMGFLEGKAGSASVFAVDPVVCLSIDVSNIGQFSHLSRLALHYLIYRELAEVLADELNLAGREIDRLKKSLTADNPPE